MQGVIQDLFRGSSGYSTVCQTCKQPSGKRTAWATPRPRLCAAPLHQRQRPPSSCSSAAGVRQRGPCKDADAACCCVLPLVPPRPAPAESSARSDSFYELDVPVKGFKSLPGQHHASEPHARRGPPRWRCLLCGTFPTRGRLPGRRAHADDLALRSRRARPSRVDVASSCHRAHPPPRLHAPPVAESLTSITSAEFMDGDNQYHCDYCAKKVGARRRQNAGVALETSRLPFLTLGIACRSCLVVHRLLCVQSCLVVHRLLCVHATSPARGPTHAPACAAATVLPAVPSMQLKPLSVYHPLCLIRQVDATRQQELRSLPPVLCMSLRRFVFDFQASKGVAALRAAYRHSCVGVGDTQALATHTCSAAQATGTAGPAHGRREGVSHSVC